MMYSHGLSFGVCFREDTGSLSLFFPFLPNVYFHKYWQGTSTYLQGSYNVETEQKLMNFVAQVFLRDFAKFNHLII